MKKITVLFFFFSSLMLFAQQTKHEVQPQETVYGISKQYGISQEELKAANPFLYERGLQFGDVLVIPNGSPNPVTENDKAPILEDYEDDEFYYIVIQQSKQTVYSLAKEYGVEQRTIESLNPFIGERGLQIGDVVRIPKKDTANTAEVLVPDGMHYVKQGETVFRIAEKYDLTMADIYAANRNLQTEGLQAGSYIVIPKEKSVTLENDFINHTVQAGETVFSLMNKYDVTLNELIDNNPELQNGLKTGMTLKIPLLQNAKLEQEPEEIMVSGAAFRDNSINMVLMLPFFLDTPYQHKGERKVAQEFYMGAQLAMEEFMHQGKKINVTVIDTKNDAKQVNQQLNPELMSKTDAIVGPFFQERIIEVAELLNSSNIPVFSPLVNSKELEPYKNVYITTPRDEQAAQIIADEIVKKDHKGKIILLTTANEKPKAEYLKTLLEEKIPNAMVTITQNVNDIKVEKTTVTNYNEDGTEEKTEQPDGNYAMVLVSDNDNLGKNFMKQLRGQKEYADYLDGYGMYFVPSFDVFNASNDVNVNFMKKIGFVFVANQMVNTYGSIEKRIIETFDKKYCQVPTKYMALGYDVVYDVLDRMDASGYISPTEMQKTVTRLSSKIGYEKAEDGEVHINRELRVIRLNEE